jgi:hypothetical protein
MPDRSADGFGSVSFRSRDRSGERPQHSLFALGATIFVSMLLALIAMEVINTIRAEAAERHAVAEFNAMLKQMDREIAALDPAVAHRTTPAARRVESLPQIHGPIHARATGAKSACISGRIALRIDNGWQGTRQRCLAISQ